MKYWESGRLRVSDNKKYLQNGATPFFWLADTAWLLFQQCDIKESYEYLKNRKEKGYSVIQCVFLHSMPEDRGSSSLAAVEKDIRNPKYWEHCDEVIRMAADLGLYMGILPAWGSNVKNGLLKEDNIEEYGVFLGERYQDYENIIWIIGGDVRGSDGFSVFRKLGNTLKEYNPDRLMGYHPFGRTSSSLWFHEEPWLDFNMFQSGHRRYDQSSLGQWDDNAGKEEYYGEDNWRYVVRDHSYEVRKPTVDGEPSYEWIPQGLHDPKEPYWQACDVRRYAYWSVFQGAMGHTYGHNAIMQFYHDLNKPGSYGVKENWKEAMHHEGAGQMKHLKDLMESVDYIKGEPREDLLLSGQKEKYDRIAIFAGEEFIFCYDYNGREFTLDLRPYQGKKLGAYWYDPVSGIFSFFLDASGKEELAVLPPKRFEGHNDWVLVIYDENSVSYHGKGDSR